MKKILLVMAIAVSLATANAQSTDRYSEEPVKYELAYLPGNEIKQSLLDTETGKLKIISLARAFSRKAKVFTINDKDLSDGIPSKPGRFRLIGIKEDLRIFLLDTETGRVWTTRVNGVDDAALSKETLVQINPPVEE